MAAIIGNLNTDGANPFGDPEFTAHLLEHDPAAVALAGFLLDLESHHESHGWDRDPCNQNRLYQVHRRTSGECVTHTVSFLQDALDHMVDDQGRDVPAALLTIAAASERSTARLRRLRPASTTQDVYQFPGARFLGWGYTGEARMMGAPDPETAENLIRQDPHLNHPDSVPIRSIAFYGRDGVTWFVLRVRGNEPSLIAAKPESALGLRGDIIHALSRMTAAVVPTPVPIVPRER